MKYYKIIINNEFIGAIKSSDFLAANPVTGWLLTSNENLGQFVEFRGILYRDYWMAPIVFTKPYTQAEISEITEEAYNAYLEAIANDEPVIIDDDDPGEAIPPAPIAEDDPDIMLDYIRQSKIAQLSNACRQTIEDGFDLNVHGIQRHFSLSTQDQLNLMNLSTLAQTQSFIPYHADGEECQFYTSQEINEIVAAATEFKIYHTTYYNALKIYVNALQTIEEISAVEYGMEIPEEFKTNILKIIES